MRQITITCAGNSAVADSYFAGYQGEHNATQLSWELSEDLQNYNYILAFALPDGSTESVIIDEYPIVYSLSQTITQLAGVINVQLTVLNDDGELIYKTQQVQLRIASSVNIDSTAKPYVSELTQAIEQFIAATKSLDNIAITAERNDKGVTISITDKDKTVSTYSIFDGSDYVITDNDKQDIAQLIQNEVRTETDTPLVTNVEYYLGTRDKVTLIFDPSSRKIKQGDTIYINFTSGDTPTILSSSACKGLKSFVPNANSICEIHAQFDGTNWVCLTAQTEV
ncbi:hypothetical protein ACTQ3J_06470 [Oscillospiraceae bacterium LCP25S3_E3]